MSRAQTLILFTFLVALALGAFKDVGKKIAMVASDTQQSFR